MCLILCKDAKLFVHFKWETGAHHSFSQRIRNKRFTIRANEQKKNWFFLWTLIKKLNLVTVGLLQQTGEQVDDPLNWRYWSNKIKSAPFSFHCLQMPDWQTMTGNEWMDDVDFFYSRISLIEFSLRFSGHKKTWTKQFFFRVQNCIRN